MATYASENLYHLLYNMKLVTNEMEFNRWVNCFNDSSTMYLPLEVIMWLRAYHMLTLQGAREQSAILLADNYLTGINGYSHVLICGEYRPYLSEGIICDVKWYHPWLLAILTANTLVIRRQMAPYSYQDSTLSLPFVGQRICYIHGGAGGIRLLLLDSEHQCHEAHISSSLTWSRPLSYTVRDIWRFATGFLVVNSAGLLTYYTDSWQEHHQLQLSQVRRIFARQGSNFVYYMLDDGTVSYGLPVLRSWHLPPVIGELPEEDQVVNMTLTSTGQADTVFLVNRQGAVKQYFVERNKVSGPFVLPQRHVVQVLSWHNRVYCLLVDGTLLEDQRVIAHNVHQLYDNPYTEKVGLCYSY